MDNTKELTGTPGSYSIEYLGDNQIHLRELAELQHQQWSHFEPDEDLAGRIERLATHCHREQVPCEFVAVRAGELLGSASLVECDMQTRKDLTPWLASVLVKPEHRHQGIASSLVRRVEEEARRLEVRRMYLFTPDAMELYRKLGWKDVEQCSYMGEAVTIMTKELNVH